MEISFFNFGRGKADVLYLIFHGSEQREDEDRIHVRISTVPCVGFLIWIWMDFFLCPPAICLCFTFILPKFTTSSGIEVVCYVGSIPYCVNAPSNDVKHTARPLVCIEHSETPTKTSSWTIPLVEREKKNKTNVWRSWHATRTTASDVHETFFFLLPSIACRLLGIASASNILIDGNPLDLQNIHAMNVEFIKMKPTKWK